MRFNSIGKVFRPSAIRGTASVGACLWILLLGACATIEHASPPVPASAGYALERPASRIATTAHPVATRAALDMLAQGGSAVDAAIAAQMVLGLVEPQSSGIGGGAFLLVWDAANARLTSLDGLAAAPARVTPGLNIDVDGATLQWSDVQRGGRSVGVPGTLAVLAKAHERYGRLPWAALIEPAIRLAESGFPLAPYLHGILAAPGAAAQHAEFHPLFFDGERRLLPAGTVIRNPDYARTMRKIAAGGPQGHLRDGGAERMVAAMQRGYRPGLVTVDDLLAYRAEERAALCGPFLVYRVCTMGPPSFGGLAVLQTLQMLQLRAVERFDFEDPAFVHLYAEAAKLALADRRKYVGDPAFVSVPLAQLLDPGYLGRRAAEIEAGSARARPAAGKVDSHVATYAPDPSDPVSTTSQLAIVDGAGNAVSMTTTNNLNFGSRLLVEGFVLNDALTNFAPPPRAGETIANRMEPGKRPVTSMAPTIVFDAQGVPVVVGGSAGGGQIVDYIAQSLIEMLANGRTPGEAIARHVSVAVAGKLQLERGTAIAAVAPALGAKGHAVEVTGMNSGLGFVARRGEGWIGAADPRRDGVAAGP